MKWNMRLVLSACSAIAMMGCSSALFTEPSGRPIIPIIDRVYLFVTPKELKDETTYPPGLTREKLIWANAAFQWEITFPPRRYAYAGLLFKRRTDLNPVFDHGTLIFALQPASAATNLSIALVDGTNQASRVLVAAPMNNVIGIPNSDRALVRIPLSAFPGEGASLDGDAAEVMLPFDPSDLTEIRVIDNGAHQGGPVMLSYLRIEH